jgi:3-hydroxybutyryl-CoA dehydratase
LTEFPLRVGDRAQFSKTVGESDVYLFAGISGDFGPNHVNEAYMRNTVFGGRIAHGALLVAYMSAASTMICANLVAQNEETPVNLGYDRIRFLRAVRLGDTITVNYSVTEVDVAKRRAVCDVQVVNQDGELAVVATNILKWVKKPA